MTNRKGQMFIVTMVFLTGLIFAVQQLLFQYTILDLSDPLQRTDMYLYRDIQSMVGFAMPGENCEQAKADLQEIHNYIKRLEVKGYLIDLVYNGLDYPTLNCFDWNSSSPALYLDISITGPGTETSGRIAYLSGEFSKYRRT